MKRPDSFNDPELNRESELSNETKEKQAYEEIIRRFQEKSEKKEELLKEHPFFYSQGREWEISSAVDCIRAKGQIDLTLAQEILTEVREQKDYWQEKATAKLVAFFEIQQELFYRYAELKDYHTQMAKVIEGQSIPGLKEISEEAEKLWADLNKNHE